MKNFFALCCVVCLLQLGTAYKYFQNKFPNGNNVPHPCKSWQLWKGVGHHNIDGGGKRNSFGKDFAAQGMEWTKELCAMDSDGDGMTNGEELGDPHCKWIPGQPPEKFIGLSHPGVCEPIDSPLCYGKNDWVLCEEKKLDCPDMDKPDTLSTDIFLPVTEVPTIETYYVCATVELPQDDDYYLIGIKPIIDNDNVMHHSVLFGCDENGGNKFLTPGECGMVSLGAGCGKLVGVWTLGAPGHCYNDKIGIHFGRNSSLKRIIIQHHWTNPSLHKGWKDGSGMKLFYTRTPREYEADSWIIGQQSIIIPPVQPETVVEGTCTPECTRKNKGSIFIADALMHAHYLGTAIKVIQKRDGIFIRTIVEENPYSYDSPIFHKFENPVEIKPGDELKISCTYNSLSRKTTTVWGLGTYDEMCYGIFFVYPKGNSKGGCMPFEEISMCKPFEEIKSKGCKLSLFNDQVYKQSMDELTTECKLGCSEKCAKLLHNFRKDPCMKNSSFRFLEYAARFERETSLKNSFLKIFKKRKMCVQS